MRENGRQRVRKDRLRGREKLKEEEMFRERDLLVVSFYKPTMVKFNEFVRVIEF